MTAVTLNIWQEVIPNRKKSIINTNYIAMLMLLRNRDSVESLTTVDFDIPKNSHDSG
jgi:hypothetical protein